MNRTWSALPHKAYSVNVEGIQYGIGLHPIWDVIPGAWNIFSMIWSDQLEALLSWSEDPKEFPINCGCLPLAAAAALEQATPSQTWGEIAEVTTPREFIEAFKRRPNCNISILPLFFGQKFWDLAEAKIASYQPTMPNIIRGDFGQARRTC